MSEDELMNQSKKEKRKTLNTVNYAALFSPMYINPVSGENNMHTETCLFRSDGPVMLMENNIGCSLSCLFFCLSGVYLYS